MAETFDEQVASHLSKQINTLVKSRSSFDKIVENRGDLNDEALERDIEMIKAHDPKCMICKDYKGNAQPVEERVIE